jgi:hypothetical protein
VAYPASTESCDLLQSIQAREALSTALEPLGGLLAVRPKQGWPRSCPLALHRERYARQLDAIIPERSGRAACALCGKFFRVPSAAHRHVEARHANNVTNSAGHCLATLCVDPVHDLTVVPGAAGAASDVDMGVGKAGPGMQQLDGGALLCPPLPEEKAQRAILAKRECVAEKALQRRRACEAMVDACYPAHGADAAEAAKRDAVVTRVCGRLSCEYVERLRAAAVPSHPLHVARRIAALVMALAAVATYVAVLLERLDRDSSPPRYRIRPEENGLPPGLPDDHTTGLLRLLLPAREVLQQLRAQTHARLD